MADERTKKKNQKGETRQLLLAAAVAEFSAPGYAGTDTNKIARRAGFAPQTFYRWFKDKREIFLAVYQQWEEGEAALLTELARQGAPAARLVEALIDHHKNHRNFRRALRQLSLEDDHVRRARAESRRRQLMRIGGKQTNATKLEKLAVALLEIERLSDAIAEGELDDLGVGAGACLEELERLIESME